MTARLSDADHHRLAALAAALKITRAEVIAKGLAALEDQLPAPVRDAVRRTQRA